MKKRMILSATLLAALALGTAQAQSNSPDKKHDFAEKRALMLKKELNLSEGQYEALLALQEKQMQHFKENGRKRKAQMHKHQGNRMEGEAPKLEKMKEQLDLSDSQVKEIKALQEKQTAFRDKMRNEMKAQRESYRAEMKSILTEEQLQKLKDQGKMMRDKRQAPPSKG
ncbi:DUF4890 domain-containing protein [Marinilongibacter aquaticus]|uniref:DUF4890 domain-containing protein n=1 Tax=Marinilongibacter aquaticus TaxID=2975157 RepID=UPI0021BD1764|nr:DUF4890 domain-containing protein [Marinilongibacter aquaticus]UBM58943.1 DUF4890 domain-containing protein [Marinilongibacter aquaticus]